ncbi:hypothetical protein BLA27_14185 [Brucella cytisi]|uniref:Uncharacterized protein n=1 Tax=Brucella cytisi TaxID=407152 RepID=A0A1J6HIL3_9HYPH|nr:hypothetical protein BLA27_14185 [Brucella cytisi]
MLAFVPARPREMIERLGGDVGIVGLMESVRQQVFPSRLHESVLLGIVLRRAAIAFSYVKQAASTGFRSAFALLWFGVKPFNLKVAGLVLMCLNTLQLRLRRRVPVGMKLVFRRR